MIKLGSTVTDKVTGIRGAATMLSIWSDGSRCYCFQPGALKSKDGTPVDVYWATGDRLLGEQIEDPILPTSVLGSVVEDTVTGYLGTAVVLNYHINGCIHFDVQAAGIHPESGEKIKSQNFDIRRLKGEKIALLSEQELAQSRKEKPSPEGCAVVCPKLSLCGHETTNQQPRERIEL